jgi:hypothetical protein
MNILMKGYVVRSVEFYNRIEGEERMNISSRVDSTVNYNDDASECICVLSLAIKNDGDKELISLKITLEAAFNYDINDNKQDIHKEVSRVAFSQAKANALALCGVIGIPPFVIPEIDFDKVERVITRNE